MGELWRVCGVLAAEFRVSARLKRTRAALIGLRVALRWC